MAFINTIYNFIDFYFKCELIYKLMLGPRAIAYSFLAMRAFGTNGWEGWQGTT